MGGKRSGAGKPVYLCIAILILLGPWACTLSRMMSTEMVDVTGEEARAHLVLGRTYLTRGEYGSALKENEKVISLAGRNVPVDEALFYIGLVHAHPGNPARDYGKSMVSFGRLIRDYPESPMVEQAKTVAGLLQENDALNRTTDKLSNINDEQKKTIDRLNSLIDELKSVDIDVEQKKRKR